MKDFFLVLIASQKKKRKIIVQNKTNLNFRQLLGHLVSKLEPEKSLPNDMCWKYDSKENIF